MQIGEQYNVKPYFAGYTSNSWRGKSTAQCGTIIWVHPKGRFAVLEFDGVASKPRECFYPDQLEGQEK